MKTVGGKLLRKLRATGFVGMWKDRKDMEDSTAYVKRIRSHKLDAWIQIEALRRRLGIREDDSE